VKQRGVHVVTVCDLTHSSTGSNCTGSS